MRYWSVKQLDAEEEKRFIDACKPEASKEDFAQLRLLATYRVWGGVTYGLYDGDHLVAINANSLNKRNWPGHGRYVHLYLNFTPASLRGRGYGVYLQRHLNAFHMEQGFSRLDCRVNSVGGLRLQWSMGHMFWGLSPKGELVVDTSLDPDHVPETVPPKAAQMFGANARPLLRKDLLAIATDPSGIYRLPQDEAEYLLRVSR